MEIIDTQFKDIKLVNVNYSQDNRGSFIKIFNKDFFEEAGLQTIFEETYYSISNKDVIRGMHFQVPPYDHEKLVHVIRGRVIDVILDIRKDSPNYKKCIAIDLKAKDHKAVYIPKGFAHGFRTLEDNTVMLYMVASGYHPNADSGIKYDSIPYDWSVKEPVVSDRDMAFVSLTEFDSPF